MNKREAAKAATRDRIIEAARRMWAEPGSYDRVTIRKLAAEIGMSTGAIFACFDGKSAVWAAAFPGVPEPVDSALTRAAPGLLAAIAGLEAGGILSTAESNASGNPEWDRVNRRITAARLAVLACAERA